MIAHLPTVKQLQYLVALRQHGHFGRAAEACFVTQSTLSAGLRELENAARRGARRTDPPRGPFHAARAEDRGKGTARPSRKRGTGRHGAGRGQAAARRASAWASSRPSPPSCCPAMLPRLRGEWPNLKLFLREETSQAACDALHRGQLDCVLLALPYGCGDVDKAPPVRRPRCSSPSRAARRRPKRSSSPARSTSTGCCCSRTAIA